MNHAPQTLNTSLALKTFEESRRENTNSAKQQQSHFILKSLFRELLYTIVVNIWGER